MLKEFEVLQKLKEGLEKGIPVRSIPLSEEEKLIIKGLMLLTSKPVLYVANVDETGSADQVAIVEAIAKSEGARVIAISSKLESEIAELSDEDAKAYLAEMGIKESTLNRLIHSG